MSTITKERVAGIASGEKCYTHDDVVELARIALASFEAEPAIHRWRRVTSEPYGPYPWHYGNFIGFSKPVEGIEDEYFYSAPPAPVSVPPAIEPDYEVIKGILPTANPDEYACCIAADMWNACRAAMLQGADGNSPVIPDGLNIRAVAALREAVRNQWLKSDDFADRVYWKSMHDIANEIVSAMLAAAPQQEAKNV
ncbi:TPA: hypothetical protein ROF77_002103 [Enterobacter asburiae]|nr:hypothetical protein [Enterobacter asburiae]